MIPVLEKSHSQRYHFHTVIDRIDLLTRDQFEDIVTDCWQRTLWGYNEIDFQYDISAGWIYYITKPSQKKTLYYRLSAVSGVYLLVHPESGKLYVGKAVGTEGFWGRWEQYVASGHGGNLTNEGNSCCRLPCDNP